MSDQEVKFAQIPHWVTRKQKTMCAGPHSYLMAMWSFRNSETGLVWASRETLNEEAGVLETVAKRHIRTLQSLGYIKRVEQGRKGTNATFYLPWEEPKGAHSVAAKEFIGGTPCSQRGHKLDLIGGTPRVRLSNEDKTKNTLGGVCDFDFELVSEMRDWAKSKFGPSFLLYEAHDDWIHSVRAGDLPQTDLSGSEQTLHQWAQGMIRRAKRKEFIDESLNYPIGI